MDSYTFQNKTYTFLRYPETKNRSLRAWSAADEYLLHKITEETPAENTDHIGIYNDRFGFLTCMLNTRLFTIAIERKSQYRAIHLNYTNNGMDGNDLSIIHPLVKPDQKFNCAVLNIPKSTDLYELYLQHIHSSLAGDGVAYCGFMTKYFTPQLLSIAERYFENVEQSLARKKARVLTLKNKKQVDYSSIKHQLVYNFGGQAEHRLQQYYGVFSSDHVDYATQFLIGHLHVKPSDEKVLDLACGNGVIAKAVQLKKPDTWLHLIDDSYLAIESAKLNVTGTDVYFHWDDGLDEIPDKTIDLIVSNPPFHLGHEINVEITIRLFEEAARKLKEDGRFICVANQHLNYKTHLGNFFNVKISARTDKYVLYECLLKKE